MKLPNAPLVEVVFEMRWALQNTGGGPVQLGNDPGFGILLPKFTRGAKELGFGYVRDMQPSQAFPMNLGYSVKNRYFLSESEQFPILQVGPGIFACNLSTDYEWGKFRKLLRLGLSLLFKSYPRDEDFSIKPIQLELRYVDAFNKELLNHNDFQRFLSENVSFEFSLSEYLASDIFEKETAGSVRILRNVKDEPDTVFDAQIATGSGDSGKTIVMTSKVVKRAEAIEIGSNTRAKVADIVKWADSSHIKTSAFFEDLMNPNLMETFKRKTE